MGRSGGRRGAIGNCPRRRARVGKFGDKNRIRSLREPGGSQRPERRPTSAHRDLERKRRQEGDQAADQAIHAGRGEGEVLQGIRQAPRGLHVQHDRPLAEGTSPVGLQLHPPSSLRRRGPERRAVLGGHGLLRREHRGRPVLPQVDTQFVEREEAREGPAPVDNPPGRDAGGRQGRGEDTRLLPPGRDAAERRKDQRAFANGRLDTGQRQRILPGVPADDSERLEVGQDQTRQGTS
mmetsp:Transcript_10484/g.24453  ORF Transcript_10484/g.24453 Transcript_10484/m.24453 type:complete len:236 (-) Transcript_10484:594-1301(-)